MNLSCRCLKHHNAALGAARVLRSFGRAVKASDPTDPDEFVLASEQFSADLSDVSAPIDERAVERAIALLNVNWTAMSVEGIGAVILAVSRVLAAAGPEVAEKVVAPSTQALSDLINATATASRDKLPGHGTGGLNLGVGGFGPGGGVAHDAIFGPGPGLGVTASFDAQHPGIANSILRSQSIYVTNEYGRHAAAFSATARKIVADGLSQGLRAEYITEDLIAAAKANGLNKPKEYWNVYSYATMNRARTNTQLVTFKEAGFTHYRFVAVMDERTSDICRALDGRVWTVSGALQKFSSVDAASPYSYDAVKDVLPWVRNRKADSGETEMYVKYRDGSEFVVGSISRSGVGTSDDAGDYSHMASSASLEAAGIMMPPLHGRCRSTVEVES